jgi:diguanylate cyclase (GGDEF)-like protein
MVPPPDNVADLVARVEQLSHAATHDDLTDLPTRSFTLQCLQTMLTSAASTREHIAVMFVDLDHFKLVNDTFGHHAGDELLQQFALRLRDSTRLGDLIGRFGGDEFVIACRQHEPSTATRVAARVLASMERPFTVAGRPVTASVSVGLAVSTPGDHDAERVLQAADIALFEAKRLGRGRCEVFSEDLRRRMVDRVELEVELRDALVRDELRLHYQPQVDLFDGSVVGVEALVRWQHPVRGLVPPLEFVPVAEESGVIGALGEWVLREACRQMAEWRDRGTWAPPVVTVNVSPLQLDAHLVDVTRDALDQYALAPRAVCVELTESAFMRDGASLAVLDELRALGCYVGIDDFGTGYSSLARLRDLPAEVLKIDRSFVAGLGGDPNDSAIVASIMGMALTMGLHVIAEGVEAPCQADALVRLGCRFAQGYLFSRPVPPAEIEALGARRLWRPTARAAAATAGPVVEAARSRRGHRRFIHEFLDQIGVPMEPQP